MKVLVAVGIVLLAGCSSGHPAAGRAAGTIRPSPTPTAPRIVVRDAVDGTVTIADLTGHLLAQASVPPMPRPVMANGEDLLPAQVRVAAGAAYYAEPTGQVHRLQPTGADTVVATFPLTTTQQELSFAVSPDGKQLMAMVLTVPPVHVPPPQDISQPLLQSGGRWSEELEVAAAGGATRSLGTTDLGTAGSGFAVHPLVIAGWDDHGPLALIDTTLAAQSVPESFIFPGSALVHLGLDGTRRQQVGGSDCHPLDELHDGTVLCYTGEVPSAYEVRTAAGQTLWRQDLPGDNYYGPVLSPDGRRIAVNDALFGQDVAPASIARQSNPQVPAQPAGWVDGSTLAIDASTGTVQLADLGDLEQPRETGLRGSFIGTL